jgi:hypothetical protein
VGHFTVRVWEKAHDVIQITDSHQWRISNRACKTHMLIELAGLGSSWRKSQKRRDACRGVYVGFV